MAKKTLRKFKFGTNGDEFKPLAEVLLSDVRQKYWTEIQLNGTTRELQLDDLHKDMAKLELNSAVPREVRTGFDTARNLYLYSWFVYRFQTVAELQAYAALDLALGRRLEVEGVKTIRNLSPRLKFAVQKGWLRADGVRIYRQNSEIRKRHAERQDKFFREFLKHENGWQNPDPRSEEQHAADYIQKLIGGIPKLRNPLAHGSQMLHCGSEMTLEICCDLINQLFPEEVSAKFEKS
jgi:hypothetical protein